MDTSTYSDPYQTIPRKAAMALAEGEIVVIGASNEMCTRAAATPATLLGVNKYTAAINTSVDVETGGVARVLAGGAISRGDWVTSNASGRAITATPAAAGATYIAVLGQALESAAADGEYLAVKVNVHLVIIA